MRAGTNKQPKQHPRAQLCTATASLHMQRRSLASATQAPDTACKPMPQSLAHRQLGCCQHRRERCDTSQDGRWSATRELPTAAHVLFSASQVLTDSRLRAQGAPSDPGEQVWHQQPHNTLHNRCGPMTCARPPQSEHTAAAAPEILHVHQQQPANQVLGWPGRTTPTQTPASNSQVLKTPQQATESQL